MEVGLGSTKMKILFVFIAFFVALNIHAQTIYDGRIGEKEILTPMPGKQPLINGAKVYGARPNKVFLYRIPCQGERPILFSVKGLPSGLKLDGKTGIITGITPATKGDFPMSITAKNKHGKVSRSFRLVVGDKLALTPPTGWNSWGGHMLMVTDPIMRKTADLFVNKGFADVGYQYISIDDCWMKISQENYDARTDRKKKQHEGFSYKGLIGDERDANGNIIPNANFPDMKAMTDYIHIYGLKAGIYSSPGPFTCQNFAGSMGFEKKDADQYAAWGFDLLKYDLCSGGKCLECLNGISKTYHQSALWQPMATYIQLQNRDILFNLCQYGRNQPWEWAPGLGISTWRSSGDLNTHIDKYFDNALRIATELSNYSKPGQWNDPDFLYIHKLRNHLKMVDPAKEIPLNTNQRYQYATLWSVVCAPYFFSCDVNEIDEFTIRLLTNATVLNINQDELGHVGEVIKNQDNEVIMIKKLADNSKALALFNQDSDNEKEMTVDLKMVGIDGKAEIFDVWRQKDTGIQSGTFKVRLSPNGVGYFIVESN